MINNYDPYNGSYPSAMAAWSKVEHSSAEKRTKPKGSEVILFPTSYNTGKSFISRGLHSYTTNYGYNTRSPASSIPSPYEFPNADYQSGRKAVVMKLREKIKGEDWNLSTFMGELPETLRYFGKTLSTVVRSYRAVRRGNVRVIRNLRYDRSDTIRATRLRQMQLDGRIGSRWGITPTNSGPVSTELASRWMEWRYAITPLMYDLNDMLKYLYNQRVKLFYRRAVSGAELRYSKTRKVESVGRAANVSLQTASCHLRIGAYYRVNPDVEAFKKLGLLNPVATLWELTPLSFVVDWFLPIGDYLGSLDAMAGVSIVSSWESQRGRTSDTYSGASDVRSFGEPPTVISTTLTGSSATYDYYSRTVGSDLSLPLPSFQIGLNAKRLLDAVSLARLFIK